MRISSKHGVNPSLEICFWCGEARGIALYGKLKDDAPAPKSTVIDYEPCDKCKEGMATGITCIEATETPNIEGQPSIDSSRGVYPTGRWVVIKEEAARRLFQPEEVLKDILKRRKVYMPPDMFQTLFKDLIKEGRKNGDPDSKDNQASK